MYNFIIFYFIFKIPYVFSLNIINLFYIPEYSRFRIPSLRNLYSVFYTPHSTVLQNPYSALHTSLSILHAP